jgi:acetyltransferase-like isoleucine patch superfamily enzyme
LSAALLFSLRRWLLLAIGIRVGQGTTVHRGVTLFDFAPLVIGAGSTINKGCYLDNRGELEIGSNVNLSHDVRIYTMGHDIRDAAFKTKVSRVRICDDAWLFPNVLVMPGVTIGRGAVVYPGSVVVKDVPDFAVVGGNPASVIRIAERCAEYRASYPVWFGI